MYSVNKIKVNEAMLCGKIHLMLIIIIPIFLKISKIYLFSQYQREEIFAAGCTG